MLASKAPGRIGDVQGAAGLIGIASASDEGVPGGMLAGDVVISWPVHFTETVSGPAARTYSFDFRKRVFLRPSGNGLLVVGIGIA